ncbi:ATP-binding protein [Massilia sp. W12]|uniref:ATP-binding protein n=1 Tax=Massilia sp. W12 TaxID=3126507 RepID=UPI0030CFF5C0
MPDMNQNRKKLPIGISSLSNIISEGFYYADKTGMFANLIQQGKYYFLSRPRRFGKSLMLDSIKEIFECNQALFQGLEIQDQWDWSCPHPVLRIDFSGDTLNSLEDLDASVKQQFDDYERQFALPARYTDHRGRLRDLILRLHQQSGQTVVVLIDEYDKPILDNIEQSELAQAIRNQLKTLYGVLKGLDAHLRFVMLTGVSKFSKVSLFSGLNNLKDITLDPAWSALCGYTEREVETVFAPELEGLEREQIRRWYNGYNWRGEAVYNPFDLLLLFDRREFQTWWFETGTPTFLTRLMAHSGFFTPELARMEVGSELISSFDVDQITPEALLFQTGYLTIRSARQLPSGPWAYTLGYPNLEVEISLNSHLLAAYTGDMRKSNRQRLQLEQMLSRNDLTALQGLFQAFFASIPYHWFVNNPIAEYEGFYASVFYSYFAALGYEIVVEDATNHGRIDMTVKLPERIYLFEFKVVELQPEGAALQQLQARAYADKYRNQGVPIVLVGVEFSRAGRNVLRFETATG